jgi:hypothetical protein
MAWPRVWTFLFALYLATIYMRDRAPLMANAMPMRKPAATTAAAATLAA